MAKGKAMSARYSYSRRRPLATRGRMAAFKNRIIRLFNKEVEYTWQWVDPKDEEQGIVIRVFSIDRDSGASDRALQGDAQHDLLRIQYKVDGDTLLVAFEYYDLLFIKDETLRGDFQTDVNAIVRNIGEGKDPKKALSDAGVGWFARNEQAPDLKQLAKKQPIKYTDKLKLPLVYDWFEEPALPGQYTVRFYKGAMLQGSVRFRLGNGQEIVARRGNVPEAVRGESTFRDLQDEIRRAGWNPREGFGHLPFSWYDWDMVPDKAGNVRVTFAAGGKLVYSLNHFNPSQLVVGADDAAVALTGIKVGDTFYKSLWIEAVLWKMVLRPRYSSKGSMPVAYGQ